MPLGRPARLGALAAVAVVAGAHAAMQERAAAPAQPIFRAGTALVRVDVTVTGRDGEAVTDLRAADFAVEEDGVAQQVETAQFVRLTGERTSDTAEPLEIRGREHALQEAAREDVRLVAIFLDDYHIDKRPEITLPLRDALTGFVRRFGPNDLLVLMEPLVTLHDLRYTRDKSDLIARIRAFEGRRGEIFPVRSPAEEAQSGQRNWMELRGGVTLSALTALATHLGGLSERRKSILFVSQGPPAPPGSPNEDRLQEALRAANRGNVTIHVLDPRPLGSVGFGGASLLHRIAAETGGRAILNTNDPSDALAGVLAEASAYYLLGYTPRHAANDGRFHAIDVKVNRRGVRVEARRGYWAASEKELLASAAAAATPVDAELRAALARVSDVAGGGRPAAVWSGVARGEGGRARLLVAWEAAAAAPGSREPRPARLAVQPVAAAGAPVADAQAIGAVPGELPLLAAFDLPPGRQRVRFAVLTAAGDTLDRWTETLMLPAFAGETLALSTPRFIRARSVAEQQALEALPMPPPAAASRFRATDRVLVDVDCYAPRGAAPVLTVELLNGAGDRLRAFEAAPLVDGRLRLALPVASLAPSLYVLRVRAEAGDLAAQQLAAFRVIR